MIKRSCFQYSFKEIIAISLGFKAAFFWQFNYCIQAKLKASLKIVQKGPFKILAQIVNDEAWIMGWIFGEKEESKIQASLSGFLG